ncbi:MAG: hypothetical protein QM611_04990 [Microbacterium sp.]|uniref:hypothetical protein n=1 Tax=Microbacterium sp. TaxID=51671 RepID=UPI0039E32A18
MGLFTERPEEPTEWAGLPSEPARPQTQAERLEDAAPAVDALGIATGARIASIAIPVEIDVAGAADGD